MEIRRMENRDREAVKDMMRVFYDSDAVLSNGSDEIFSADIEACVEDCPYLDGYVFECDGQLAGYGMVARSFSTEFGKPCAWIEDIYLKPEFRGKGIAKQFFEMLFSTYKNSIFRLEVEMENKNAFDFYTRRGFEVIPYTEMIKKD